MKHDETITKRFVTTNQSYDTVQNNNFLLFEVWHIVVTSLKSVDREMMKISQLSPSQIRLRDAARVSKIHC